MEERLYELFDSKNKDDSFNIKIELDDPSLLYVSYYSPQDSLESRGELLGHALPTECFLPDLSRFINLYESDYEIYVASSKDETLTIYVGFDKRYFKNLSIEDTYFYESTLKKLYYYLISTKLNRLETFEKTIVCHCQYYGISNTDAAKLIGINISDYEMLLSGKIEHINNLNRNDVLNTLGIPQEENREAFFQHLLTKIEFKDIEDVR